MGTLLVLSGLLLSCVSASAVPTVGSPSVTSVPNVPHGPFGAQGDNWTMFMGDPEHTGYQSVSPSLQGSTAANLSLQWSYQTGSTIVAEPIVANGRVYVGSWDGDEYSLLASNGSKVWSTFTGQSRCTASTPHLVGVSSTATLTSTDLYVGGGQDHWEAMDPATGSILWQVYTGNSNATVGGGYYNWASPLIYNGFAYIGLSSHCDKPLVKGQLLKVNLATHAVAKVFNTTTGGTLGATIWSSPAVNPATGTIFFATGNLYGCCGTNTTLDDSIVALNASRMTEVGHYQVPYAQRITDGDFGASVTLFQTDNGTPMVGDVNKDGVFFALRQANVSAGPLWTANISQIDTYSSAAFAHGSIYLGSARTTNPGGGEVEGAVRSFNATTGHLNWQRTLDGRVAGPVVVAGDVVIAAGGKELVVLGASTGKLLYRFNSTAEFYAGPSVAGGRIYVGNIYGKLYCIGFPLSAKITANPTGGPAPLTVTFRGTGFGGEPGYTYAWSFGDGTHSTKADPSHVYKGPGSFSASLTVTDQSGSNATTATAIVVTEPRRPRGSGD